jgi:short-subunit dehydrogenase
MELGNARILLTGATGGLGGALAHELSAAGAELLLAARDMQKLGRLRDSLNTALSSPRPTSTAATTSPRWRGRPGISRSTC